MGSVEGSSQVSILFHRWSPLSFYTVLAQTVHLQTRSSFGFRPDSISSPHPRPGRTPSATASSLTPPSCTASKELPATPRLTLPDPTEAVVYHQPPQARPALVSVLFITFRYLIQHSRSISPEGNGSKNEHGRRTPSRPTGNPRFCLPRNAELEVVAQLLRAR